MKRIITAILSISLFLLTASGFTLAEAEEKTGDIKNSSRYRVLNGLGAIPENLDETLTGEQYVTRGEFAAIIDSIIKREIKDKNAIPSEWNEAFWGEDNKDAPEVPKSETGYYSDLDKSYEYFDEINFVTSYGLMNGTGDGQFMPDDNLKFNHMLKILITMLGYKYSAEVNGGYPSGYITAAAELGIVISGSEYVTYWELSDILYKILNINIMEFDTENGEFIYRESEATFLSKWFKASYRTGIFTDNSITSITGEASVSKDSITVGEYEYLDGLKYDVASLLGYNVKIYYSIDKDRDNVALAMEALNNNEAVSFDILDFEEYENKTIKYNEDGRLKNIKLQDTVFLIYNGKKCEMWDANIFEFKNGSVNVIKNGGWYDVIMIEDYKTAMISAVDAVNMKLYNKLADEAGGVGAIIDCSEAYEAEKLFVYSKVGDVTDLSSIAANTVADVIINGDYIKLILTNEVIKDFKVQSVEKNQNGMTVIKNGDAAYTVSDDYYKQDESSEFTVGETYTLYLNRKGFAVWQTKKVNSEYIVGYLVKTVFDEDNEKLIIKIFSESGKMISVNNEERVTYRENAEERLKLENEALFSRLRYYNGLVRYRLSEAGRLNYIELAATEKQDKEYLQPVYNSGNTSLVYKSYGTWGYFGGELYVDNSTKVFRIPSSEEFLNDDAYYSVVSRGSVFSYDHSYAVAGYGLDGDTRYANYMVVKQNKTQTLSRNSQSYLIVEKVYQGIDADDEACTIIEGWKRGVNISLQKVTLFAKLIDGKTVLDSMDDALNTGASYKAQKGDILRCAYSGANSEYIEQAELFYRLNGVNPAWPEGKKGFLAGSIGYFSAEKTVIEKTLPNGQVEKSEYTWHPYSNPYAMNAQGVYSSARTMTSGNYRVYYGFVQKVENGLITLTTKDLSQGEFETGNTRYDTDYYFLAQNIVTLTVDGDKYSVAAGSVNHIRSAENYGGDCTRMINITQAGIPYMTFIINVL